MIEKAFDLIPNRTEETNQKLVQYREKFIKKKKEQDKLTRKRLMEEKQKAKKEKDLIFKIRESGVKLASMVEEDENKKSDDSQILGAIETSHPSGCKVKKSYRKSSRLSGNFEQVIKISKVDPSPDAGP